MRFAYPCNIVFDEGGPVEISSESDVVNFSAGYSVKFPDVYGANTCGDSWEEAIEMAEECLGLALGFSVRANEDLPTPSPARDGQVLIPVPFLVAAKLTIYTAMREQGITYADMASKLSLDEDAVRKLVDPRYRTHVSQIERALRVVGRALVVEDCDAVPTIGREQKLMAQVNS
jgi:antitoxin HicB